MHEGLVVVLLPEPFLSPARVAESEFSSQAGGARRCPAVYHSMTFDDEAIYTCVTDVPRRVGAADKHTQDYAPSARPTWTARPGRRLQHPDPQVRRRLLRRRRGLQCLSDMHGRSLCSPAEGAMCLEICCPWGMAASRRRATPSPGRRTSGCCRPRFARRQSRGRSAGGARGPRSARARHDD